MKRKKCKELIKNELCVEFFVVLIGRVILNFSSPTWENHGILVYVISNRLSEDQEIGDWSCTRRKGEWRMQ